MCACAKLALYPKVKLARAANYDETWAYRIE